MSCCYVVTMIIKNKYGVVAQSESRVKGFFLKRGSVAQRHAEKFQPCDQVQSRVKKIEGRSAF